MRVLVINGHPREGSLSDALVDSYTEGARESGAEVIRINVRELDFDRDVSYQHTHEQPDEDCIIEARQQIAKADHLVFVYPTWWGTMPALLKSFIDRVFVAGFAFREIEGGTGYEPLLRGKTAQLITTMDTPAFVYRFIYGSPGHRAMRKATLGFCGFTMRKTIRLGIVRGSTTEIRKEWIERVRLEGLKIGKGSLPAMKRISIPVMNWLKAIRLQFYPMSFIAYTMGAYAAESAGYGFDPLIFWLGYAWLFLLEVATVLSNDYFDFASDRQNRFFSPFTGGSRVLVESLLDFRQVRTGIVLVLGLSFGVLFALLSLAKISFANTIVVCGGLFVLALGYTVPPVKLSYRGLGEITVGITHSFAVIICGYMFQGGAPSDYSSLWLGLPLFLAVLPSIILAGVPDYEADKAVGKRTLAVRFGKKRAAGIALFSTALALCTVALFNLLEVLPGAFNGILIPVIPHAMLLGYLLIKFMRNPNPPQRIDGLLVAALTFIFWFGIIPMINLS